LYIGGSLLSWIMRHEFSAASILVKTVRRPSASTWERPNTSRKQHLVEPTILSHQPPPPHQAERIEFCSRFLCVSVAERNVQSEINSLLQRERSERYQCRLCSA
jgi:hypothetical protein